MNNSYIPLFLYKQPKQLNHLKLLQNSLKLNPTLFHKKKSQFDPEVINNNHNEQENELTESYLFQDANNIEINELKNNLNNKELTIEANAKNYLNYILNNNNNNKRKKNYNLKPINLSYGKQNNNSNVNTPLRSFSNETDSISNSNFSNNGFNLYNNTRNYTEINKYEIPRNKSIDSLKYFGNYHKYNINNSEKNNNVLPKIYKKTTDITNPNYYDEVSMQLLRKKNLENLEFNRRLIEDKINVNKSNKIILNKDDEFTLPPGRISNPKYYNLGESRLKNNIIINPGNHCNSPSLFPYNYHKLKSEFA